MALGADEVFAYDAEGVAPWPSRLSERFDFVLDCVGNDSGPLTSHIVEGGVRACGYVRTIFSRSRGALLALIIVFVSAILQRYVTINPVSDESKSVLGVIAGATSAVHQVRSQRCHIAQSQVFSLGFNAPL